jgi:hypothetical protein
MTPQELKIIEVALQMNSEWQARTFQIVELSIALEIFKKLKTCVKDNIFIEWDPSFSSEEKVFIKKLIEEIKWTVLEGESVLSVLETIK